MQQQTNFFTPTQKHLIQLHGFPNITDIIYVKPLYSVRSLSMDYAQLFRSSSLWKSTIRSIYSVDANATGLKLS